MHKIGITKRAREGGFGKWVRSSGFLWLTDDGIEAMRQEGIPEKLLGRAKRIQENFNIPYNWSPPVKIAYKLPNTSFEETLHFAEQLVQHATGFLGIHVIDMSEPISAPGPEALYSKLFKEVTPDKLVTPTANHVYVVKGLEDAVARHDGETIVTWLTQIRCFLDDARRQSVSRVHSGDINGFSPEFNMVFLLPFQDPQFPETYGKQMNNTPDTTDRYLRMSANQLIGSVFSRSF